MADKWKESNDVPFRVWRRMQKKKEKKNQRRRKSTKTLLFLTESLKDWSKFLREKPDYSGNKTKTSLFVGGVNL